MSPIRVVLAQSHSDVLAGIIADALIDSLDFELVGDAVMALPNIGDGLPEDHRGVDVLIVVGDISQSLVDAFVARYEGVVVSHIVIGSDAVRFNLTGLGLDQLLSALRVFAREGGPQRRALEYQLVPALPGVPEQACKLVPVDPIRRELIGACLAWIDAALLHYHRAWPETPGDVRGRARSWASVVSLLGARDEDEGNAELVRSGRAAEAAAGRLFQALDSADARNEPLARCYRRLALTRTEMKLALLALAPEFGARYQTVFGILDDDLGRRSPSFALACAVVGEASDVRAELATTRNLTRWRMLESCDQLPRAEEPLRLDVAVVAWLTGDETALLADPRLRGCVQTERWLGVDLVRRPSELACSQKLMEALDDPRDTDWLILSGDDSSGWQAHLELATRLLNVRLLRIPLAALSAQPPNEAAEAGVRLARAASALGMTPVIDGAEVGQGQSDAAAIRRLASVLAPLAQCTVLVAPDAARFAHALRHQRVRQFERARPDAAATAATFLAASCEADLSLTHDECERLALAFPLGLAEVEDAVRLAVMNGALSQSDSRHYEVLAAMCRRIASPELPRFGRRIAPTYTLDDVVLPADWHAQLEELVNHVVHAPQVMNAWGFAAQTPYGRGVAALFSGASGTGKTMAAQAIAHALKTEAFLVDLSRVVSKFIGESEKNLDAVFTDAERAGAVLVFDEADAIFGKRSEIKDAHDRYANIEVAYLLQRMESFSGLIILTTNFRQNLDQAFLRRLRFVVEFPKPDAAAREAIWRRCLPDNAPVARDVDFAALGRRIELTGGNIRQITLRAAFAAASEPSGDTQPRRIEMRHLIAAARAELVKLGRGSAVRDLEEYEAFRLKTSQQAA